jgi:hypothetical protein
LLKGDIAAQSLADPGYVKLASGLIIQWGSFSVTTTSANTYVNNGGNFPIPFPTALLHLSGAPINQGTGQVLSACRNAPSLDQWSFASVSSLAGATFNVQWLAIGY